MEKKVLILIAIVGLIAVQGLVLIVRPGIVVKSLVCEEAAGSGAISKTHGGAAEVSAVACRNDITEQSLELELVGTAVVNPKDPIAFIKDLESGRQATYKLGSMIRDARVVKIAMGEVSLDVNGRLKSLYLKRQSSVFAQADSPVISFAGNQIVVSKEKLLSQGADIVKTLKQVKVDPVYNEDSKRAVGMRINNVPENSVFAQVGIKSNDVVTAINGQHIDSYQKALQVFAKERNKSDIQVSLLRNAQPTSIFYRLQ